jgi:hypothetical protein
MYLKGWPVYNAINSHLDVHYLFGAEMLSHTWIYLLNCGISCKPFHNVWSLVKPNWNQFPFVFKYAWRCKLVWCSNASSSVTFIAHLSWLKNIAGGIWHAEVGIDFSLPCQTWNPKVLVWVLGWALLCLYVTSTHGWAPAICVSSHRWCHLRGWARDSSSERLTSTKWEYVNFVLVGWQCMQPQCYHQQPVEYVGTC